ERWTQHTQDLPLHPRALAAHAMDRRFPQRVDFHGYLNGPLTGSSLVEPEFCQEWSRCVHKFAGRSDMYGFQRLMPEGMAASLLPKLPLLDRGALSFEQQLELGFRQAQRIRVFQGPSRFVFPFESDRWVNYWLNRPWNERYKQQKGLDFVRTERSGSRHDPERSNTRKKGRSQFRFHDCYMRNQSCAKLVETALKRLKGRRIFDES